MRPHSTSDNGLMVQNSPIQLVSIIIIVIEKWHVHETFSSWFQVSTAASHALEQGDGERLSMGSHKQQNIQSRPKLSPCLTKLII